MLLLILLFIPTVNAFNLFLFDKDPEINASYHDDKQCIKMILEYTQMLYTIVWLLKPSALAIDYWKARCIKFGIHPLTGSEHKPYKMVSSKHPIIVWGRESDCNFSFIRKLAISLSNEYTKRFNKTHKCLEHIKYFHDIEYFIPFEKEEFTLPALAMPDFIRNRFGNYEIINNNAFCRAKSINSAIMAYRLYMILCKSYATYKYSSTPYWFTTKYFTILSTYNKTTILKSILNGKKPGTRKIIFNKFQIKVYSKMLCNLWDKNDIIKFINKL